MRAIVSHGSSRATGRLTETGLMLAGYVVPASVRVRGLTEAIQAAIRATSALSKWLPARTQPGEQQHMHSARLLKAAAVV